MLQTQYHALHHLTSAHLAQTMTLLSLTNDELLQQVEAELSTNPALELVESHHCPNCHRLVNKEGLCPYCSLPDISNAEEPIVFVSSRDDFNFSEYTPSEDVPEDNYSTSTDDLPTYVMRQIATELKSEDRPIAAHLLMDLDDDGFITTSLIEVAHYYHVSIDRIKNIIKLIQRADPMGVGSSCPQEALLVQLAMLSETRNVPLLAKIVIEKGMDLLGKHQYSELARRLKITSLQAIETANFITENLNPYPARSHWGESNQKNNNDLHVYHRPDIIITFINDHDQNNLIVEIILPLRGFLRVNPMFRQAIHEAEEDKKVEWKADMDRASLFVKCLQQRNHTMKRLMSQVVQLQHDFILHGEVFLKPLTRVEISESLGVHESTISRAVSGKAVQLPNGRIVPLARFFNRNLNARSILRNIISEEKKPLSDTELMKILAKQGIQVSRRTVAKYRAMEGILPAYLRHHISQIIS